MAFQTWSDDAVLRQLDSGSMWAGPFVTYGFATSSDQIYGPNGETRGFRPLNESQQAAATLTATIWGSYIAPTMFKVSGSSSQIDFGISTTGVDFAHAYFPREGSIWFAASAPDLRMPKVGDYGFSTFVHEFGHALGLDHMGDYNGSDAYSPSCYQDSTVYSIMSYFGPDHGRSYQSSVAWADWVAPDGVLYSPQTPMLNDVMAIQAIYGENTTTEPGDTVYGFNCNVSSDTKAVFDFEKNKNPILTIYDAAGNDTLDLSHWSLASKIDLEPGHFSSCNGMTNNVVIARSCDIENAIGGSGDDELIGNALANRLAGGKGNDFLDGGLGVDSAVFNGLRSDFKVAVMNERIAVQAIKDKALGLDTLTEVEVLQFDDSNLIFDGNDSVAAQAFRLYQAAFDRRPDLGGEGFWIHAMESGMQLHQVAELFMASPEFATLYGQNTSDQDFVNLLYRNVLNRAPELEGNEYWLKNLAAGWERSDVLLCFSESPENQAQVAELIAQGVEYIPYAG